MTSLNGYTFGWTNRRLTSATSTDTNISYTYNHDGIRTGKTINGITITYKVDENNNVIEQTDGTNTIKFVYDSDATPVYMEYNGTVYYYEKNLQGDIVAILDTNGNTVVEYTYDIWGKLLGITGELADTLGVANPLRYRGYYYDTETGLYYLQSRYYSPDLMRFISQDDPVLSNAQGEPLGSNLYVYCVNNCVNTSDPTGKAAFKAIGLQLCVSIGKFIAGFEILWDTSKWKPYLFFFIGGLSKNFFGKTEDVLRRATRDNLIYSLKKVPKISMNTLNKLSKFSISVSFIAVFGNKYASFPKTYEGWFTGFSISIKHITLSAAYGRDGKAKIGSFGLGVTSSLLSLSFGQTYYWRVSNDSKLIDVFKPLKNSISNRLAWLKTFTFLVI